MLNIPGPRSRYCDGISRRNFLKIGTFAFGATALSMADILRAQANQGSSASHKAVIHVFLGGGPPHQDTWEIKTEAPEEIRGPFQPISTRVPGIQICEVFPRMAAHMDKCAIIRSIVGQQDRHDAIQCHTGYPFGTMSALGGRPSMGAFISKVQGPVDPSVPPFVGLCSPTQHRPWSDSGQVGFLGPSVTPFKPEGPGMADLRLNGVTVDRFGDRRTLRNSFDSLRRDIDANGSVLGMDAAMTRAMDVLTSSRLLEAMDVSREPLNVRERYGDGKPYQFQYDGAPTVNDQLLMARRLVEAGVRCVTLTYGRWDAHSKNFDLVRDHGPKLDQCLSALLEDLESRGLFNDVTVLVWGEFGRTPRVNNAGGRDHWAPVGSALLFGGGIRGGQVIGSTNRLGEHAASRPVTQGEILATVYHNLGINPMITTVLDPTGRPQTLIDKPVLPELV